MKNIINSPLHNDFEKTLKRHPNFGRFPNWFSGVKTSRNTGIAVTSYNVKNISGDNVFLRCDLQFNLEKRAQSISVKNLRDYGVLDTVLNLQARNNFPPDYVDLDILWRVASYAKPKTILELGSGYSTIIFGEYFKQTRKNTESIVTALESTNEFAAMMTTSLSEAKLDRYINLVVPSIKAANFNGKPTEVFDASLDKPFDLIYLDSAPDKSDTQGADFILLNRQILKKGTIIVVDCRLAALMALSGSDLNFEYLTNFRDHRGLSLPIDGLATYTTVIQVIDI